MENKFENADIVSITDLDRDDIMKLCEIAKGLKESEKGNERYLNTISLDKRVLGSLFYEPSTRTKLRFETAIEEFGGKIRGFSGTEGTSIMKKESIRDTIAMMEANHCDILVMRHPIDGSVQWAADVAQIPVINGGDGMNEHPTQALLDVFTLYMNNNYSLNNLNIGLGGDLAHGRTITSLTLALSNFENVKIRWSAEDEFGIQDDLIKKLQTKGIEVIRKPTVEEVIQQSDAYYMTRFQLERMKNISPQKIQELMEIYRIDLKKIAGSKIQIMHPLPINSELSEITRQVVHSKNFKAYVQAENGIFMTKAILYLILNHKGYITFNEHLPQSLEFGNNRLKRDIKQLDKGNLDVKKIENGSVIDHLETGASKDLVDILKLNEKYSISCTSEKHNKSYLKTELTEFEERQLKKISMRSPEPTINIIKNGKVIEKYVYLLCGNENCITTVIEEGVPSNFYNDNGTIICRNCRKPYIIRSRKISEEEKRRYINGLPTKVDRILC